MNTHTETHAVRHRYIPTQDQKNTPTDIETYEKTDGNRNR